MGFKDMSPELHLEVCDFLQRGFGVDQHAMVDMDWIKKVLELPRGHLKTSMCTIGYPLWRVVHNPSIRILLVSATGDNACKWITMLGDVAQTNQLFQWLFPEVIPDFKTAKWTSHELEFARPTPFPESTIEGIGVGGTAVSRHYDLMIKDDLVNEDHLISDEVMQKQVDWHRRSHGLFVNPVRGEEIVVGNRWAFNDVISWVKENQPHFKAYSRAAIENGQPIWPERFTLEGLQRILEDQGPKIFSAQYMNNPVHEDSRAFDKSWFRFYKTLPPVPLKVRSAIDPAISTSRGDYSAIVTVGMDPDRNIYILDCRRGRWGVDELIDNIFDVSRIWTPVEMGLETVMFQKALLWPIKEAMRREQHFIRITELRPSSKITKEARITALHEYFANGSLWLRENMTELQKELLEFPVGAHDDMIDALAYVIQLLKPATANTQVNNNPFQLENVLVELKKKHKPTGSFKWTWHEKESAHA